jgi:hypothetical protein
MLTVITLYIGIPRRRTSERLLRLAFGVDASIGPLSFFGTLEIAKMGAVSRAFLEEVRRPELWSRLVARKGSREGRLVDKIIAWMFTTTVGPEPRTFLFGNLKSICIPESGSGHLKGASNCK